MKEDRYAPAERATACDSVAALAAASGAERGGGDASGAAAEVGASWDGGHSAAAPCASAAAAAASAAAPVVQVPAIVPDVPMRRALGLAAIGSASDALVPDIRQFGGSGLGSVRGVRPVESACVSGLLSGQPTGSETEPWSMMGSFEDLLNGLVTDEPEEEEEEEEATLPGRSRFARFFSSPNTEEHMVGGGLGARRRISPSFTRWHQAGRAFRARQAAGRLAAGLPGAAPERQHQLLALWRQRWPVAG